MSMGYIRARYRVPLRLGGPVKYEGRNGKVVGVDGAYVLIRLDGEEQARPYHPRWHLLWPEENGPAGYVPAAVVLPAPVWPVAATGEPQWSGV